MYRARFMAMPPSQSRTIAVQANNGVVTLNGNVANDSERGAAANDAATVNGVKTVVNNLQVQQAEATPPPPVAEQPKPAPAPVQTKREPVRSVSNSNSVRHQAAKHTSGNSNDGDQPILARTAQPDANPVMQSAPVMAPAPPPPAAEGNDPSGHAADGSLERAARLGDVIRLATSSRAVWERRLWLTIKP